MDCGCGSRRNEKPRDCGRLVTRRIASSKKTPNIAALWRPPPRRMRVMAAMARLDGFHDLANRDRQLLHRQAGALLMIALRRLAVIRFMIAAGLMFSSQSFAQQPDVGDQPGLVPNDSVKLEPQFPCQV